MTIIRSVLSSESFDGEKIKSVSRDRSQLVFLSVAAALTLLLSIASSFAGPYDGRYNGFLTGAIACSDRNLPPQPFAFLVIGGDVVNVTIFGGRGTVDTSGHISITGAVCDSHLVGSIMQDGHASGTWSQADGCNGCAPQPRIGGTWSANREGTPVDTPTVSLSRGSSPAAFTNATSAACVDDPLTPTRDPAILDQQPSVTSGLVADGVTPLLVKITPPNSLTQPTDYNITFSFPNGGSANLAQHFLSPGNPVPVTKVTLTANTPAWEYIFAFNPQDITFPAGSTELTVEMKIQKSDGTGSPSITPFTFKIRKPPIVLVHGYNANKSSWSFDFLLPLQLDRDAEFVIPITYAPKSVNTPGRLDTMAHALDGTLRTGIENHSSGPLKDWAFTRYDLICHSQGGILARMLCTESSPWFRRSPPFAQQHFRSSSN